MPGCDPAAQSFSLVVVPGRYAVARLEAGAAIPEWAWRGEAVSIAKTRDETSILCDEGAVPVGVRAERGFAMLRVNGDLPFEVVGVMASLAGPLAAAGISIFVFSTFDTDYLMMRDTDLGRGIAALRDAGWAISP
jgi:hypothetical protein